MGDGEMEAREAALQAAERYDGFMVPVMFSPLADLSTGQAALKSGERVLDIACGSGVVARRAAQQVGSTGRVAALDLNPAMLEIARRHAPTAGAAVPEWHHGSAQSLPFPDASFDVVLCQQGLQFFPDRALALSEMWRVLVPGGRVVVLVNHEIGRNPLYQQLSSAALRLIGVDVYAAAFALGDAEKLRHLLTGANFEAVTLREAVNAVRFPSARGFVQNILLGASAAVPALAALTPAARVDLGHRIEAEMGEYLSAHTDGQALLDEMVVLIAQGWKPA
ncbi:methyltransferase domain-containing protein [Deinococcus sp. KNUC1210]|uniref:class I SAM-dependent methyltransferase n=1 Tax=Deinococcus sp. KNUC1210 TaxID=2917691 RepID=UPI001EEFF6A5|nr:methyltransferase domain-containing protein [Deinococcus sp. KNUC1210]ULH15591.1 methyltransferase domain-containing protein [Deinococcus sp. KNUC1210]